jgi:hypothetical protein
MDPGGTSWNNMNEDLPRDITVLTANSSIVYSDGTLADVNNGLYNHHLLIMDLNKGAQRVAQCPNGRGVEPPMMSLLTGSSEDKGGAFFTDITGQVNSGYYIGKNDRIIMNGDIVNYSNEMKEVYWLMDIQYIDGKVPDYMEVANQLWSVGTCDGQVGFVKPPPGKEKFVLASKDMKIMTDGLFLAFSMFLITSRRS